VLGEVALAPERTCAYLTWKREETREEPQKSKINKEGNDSLDPDSLDRFPDVFVSFRSS
jgi:hypothetical protein